MARTLPKSVTESKPLHAVAGASDLAVEKIRDLSKLAADKFAAMEADPTAVSNRVQEGIEQRVGMLGSTLRVASADVRTQIQDLSVRAQQALHAAFAQTSQTYDALADRGRDVVVRFGGVEGHQLEGGQPAPKPEPKTAASPATAPTALKKPAKRTAPATPKPATSRKTSRTTAKKSS